MAHSVQRESLTTEALMAAKTTVMWSRFVCQRLMMMKHRQLLMALMLLLQLMLMRDYLTSVTQLRCLETINSRESAYTANTWRVFSFTSPSSLDDSICTSGIHVRMGVDHGGYGGTSPPEFGAGGLSPRCCHVAKF